MAVIAYLWLVLVDGRDWLNILVLEWFFITMLTFANWSRHKSMRR